MKMAEVMKEVPKRRKGVLITTLVMAAVALAFFVATFLRYWK
jgi:hypothetical protein